MGNYISYKEKCDSVLMENKHLRRENSRLKAEVSKVKEINIIFRNRYAQAIIEIKELLNLEKAD